jgi:hypothetical protein
MYELRKEAFALRLQGRFTYYFLNSGKIRQSLAMPWCVRLASLAMLLTPLSSNST